MLDKLRFSMIVSDIGLNEGTCVFMHGICRLSERSPIEIRDIPFDDGARKFSPESGIGRFGMRSTSMRDPRNAGLSCTMNAVRRQCVLRFGAPMCHGSAAPIAIFEKPACGTHVAPHKPSQRKRVAATEDDVWIRAI
ncbi:hypothetical protein [Paraburkholderia sp. UCT31]|uniref:hypothetical protein n=1 Tax=Paraburkholderia sp. UCT31 TaxID=2615209 RepID=UPI001654E692|nr:hypothetical protein [Paraburkholderia sp. UCT31]